MKPRLIGLAGLAILLVLIAWFATRSNVPPGIPSRQPPPPRVHDTSSPTPERAQRRIVKQEIADASPALNKNQPRALISSTNAPRAYVPPVQPAEPEALVEIDKVRLMLRDYRTVMGEN